MRLESSSMKVLRTILLVGALGTIPPGVTIAADTSPYPASVTIPVVTDAPGAAGERFRTVITISNRGSVNLYFSFLPWPEGTPTCDRSPGIPSGRELTAGSSLTFSATELAFGFGPTGTGFLEVVPSDRSRLDDLVVRARLYAETGAGTLGQEIPVFRSTDPLSTDGVNVHLVGLGRSPEGTRTNVGILIPTRGCGIAPGQTVPVRLTAYWASGAQNGEPRSWQAPIGGLARINDVFAALGLGDNCPDCRIAVSSPLPVVAFASVVEAGTSDPTFVEGRLQ